MSKHMVLGLTLLLAAIGYGLYAVGTAHHLFWVFWWYDVVMHFLVGLTGGLGIFWGLFHSRLIFRAPKSMRFMITATIVCVMLVGIGWEIFEYVNHITDSNEGYALDTMDDLILDGSGAALAALLATRKRHG